MTDRVTAAKDRLAKITARISELEGWSRFTADQLLTFMQPLAQKRVSTRSQSGSNLSYVEAHDIKNMLIRMFGFGGFSSVATHSEVKTGEWFVNAKSGKDNVKVLAIATVEITIHPPRRPGLMTDFPEVKYAETAVSSQTGADEGDTADFAMKTAESDAFKRAAIFLGTQFGLSLYAKGATEDQVIVLFDPVQKELLTLAGERARIHAFLASASAPTGASVTSEPAPSTTPDANTAQGASTASLQGAFNGG